MAKASLKVVGVRHHSPACSRLVLWEMEHFRPDVVLIEGPCDFNSRMDELALEHQPPIAIFSFFQKPVGFHSSWTPFCVYSPEWQALRQAQEQQIPCYFIDLPAWAEALEEVENRFADARELQLDYSKHLADKLGLEGLDSVWDHLFEQEQSSSVLTQSLDQHFKNLRQFEPTTNSDQQREEHMSSYIAWAMRKFNRVLVVCGGFHKPVLEKDWSSLPPEIPKLPEPPDKSGSYLVPYSFKRLDSFTGYSAGMPSPYYYQSVWEHGPEKAGELILEVCVERLRKLKNQHISSADLIACRNLSQSLAKIRGHEIALRSDILDGLAAGLVKEALEHPLPWTRRGSIRGGTHALVVEIVKAFSGEGEGQLAPDTPLPPLVFEIRESLLQFGIQPTWEPKILKLPQDSPKSHFLHRLNLLGLPGFKIAKRETQSESWSIQKVREFDSGVLEASIWGASLEQACLTRLQSLIQNSQGELDRIAQYYLQALEAGFQELNQKLLKVMLEQVLGESELARLGAALRIILDLWRRRERDFEAQLLDAMSSRALWLLEGLKAPKAAADKGQLVCMTALRDCHLLRPIRAAKALMRRACQDPECPPALRGAALGFLFCQEVEDMDTQGSLKILNRNRSVDCFGDFMVGLLALARDRIIENSELLQSVDTIILSFTLDDFLQALPALRLAFSYLPPWERAQLAQRILSLHGETGETTWELLELPIEANSLARNQGLEQSVSELIESWELS